MRGDLLRMLQRAAVLEIGGNSGRSKSMTAGEVGEGDPPLYHVKHVSTYHRIAGQLVAPFKRPEQRPRLIVADTGAAIHASRGGPAGGNANDASGHARQGMHSRARADQAG